MLVVAEASSLDDVVGTRRRPSEKGAAEVPPEISDALRIDPVRINDYHHDVSTNRRHAVG